MNRLLKYKIVFAKGKKVWKKKHIENRCHKIDFKSRKRWHFRPLDALKFSFNFFSISISFILTFIYLIYLTYFIYLFYNDYCKKSKNLYGVPKTAFFIYVPSLNWPSIDVVNGVFHLFFFSSFSSCYKHLIFGRKVLIIYFMPIFTC